MSVGALNWAYQQTTGSPLRKALLVSLADQSNEDGFCWPGQASIARRLEYSERSVRRGLWELEESGLITRTARFWADSGKRRTDTYQLAMKPPDTLAGGDRSHRQSTTGATGHCVQKPPDTLAGYESSAINHQLNKEVLTREKQRVPKEPAVATTIDPITNPNVGPKSDVRGAGAPTAPKQQASPHELPEGWVPDEAARSWTQEHRGVLDLAVELAKFRDYQLSTGAKRRNWDASWRNWIRRAGEFKAARPGPARQEPRSLVPDWVPYGERPTYAQGIAARVKAPA